MNPSEAARRTGMNEAELRTMNSIPPRMLIKAGSTLLVPRSASMEADVTSKVADAAQVSFSPEIVTRRTTVKARKGESVGTIASRYGLPAASVAAWNDVSASAAFKMGHQVIVFLPIKNRSTTAAHEKTRPAAHGSGRAAKGLKGVKGSRGAKGSKNAKDVAPVKRSTSRAVVKTKKQ